MSKRLLIETYYENPEWVRNTFDRVILEHAQEEDNKLTLVNTWRPRERYPKVKLRGSGMREEFFVHHLAVLVRDPLSYEAYAWSDEDFEISHLCSNRRCVTEGHLVVETRSANQLRDTVRCYRSVQALAACNHDPRCELGH